MRAISWAFCTLIMLFALSSLAPWVLAETLPVSKVRFDSVTRAQVFCQAAFPQNEVPLTLKIALNASPEPIALFQRTLTFQFGQLTEEGSFVEALIDLFIVADTFPTAEVIQPRFRGEHQTGLLKKVPSTHLCRCQRQSQSEGMANEDNLSELCPERSRQCEETV